MYYKIIICGGEKNDYRNEQGKKILYKYYTRGIGGSMLFNTYIKRKSCDKSGGGRAEGGVSDGHAINLSLYGTVIRHDIKRSV